MRNQVIILLLCLFLLTAHASQNPPLITQQLAHIVDDPDRYDKDRLRDVQRLPIKVMKFSGVAKGDKVLDIFAGGGWYSELFSKAVGPSGTVYAQNDALTWRFGEKEMKARTQGNRLANVIRLDQVAIADIQLPLESIDLAFMAINYHDLFFTYRIRNGHLEQMRKKVVDYKAALTAIKKVLKPNGVLIIIDHAAEPGSGYEAANDLHRIDPNIVKYQLNDLGFVLQEEAFYLRNPNDDKKTSVFAPEIRGLTDRFIYKFGKK